MRYYTIKVLNSASNVIAFNYSTNTFAVTQQGYTWTSHPNGVFNPAALNIDFDFAAFPFGQFQTYAHVRIWGVGLPVLSQAANLNGYSIELDAGMQSPYDLNSAAPAGQILAGQVYQCFGNWEGTNQYLDLVVANASVLPDAASDIAFNWKANTALADAINQSLSAAFPGFTIDNTIQRVVVAHDEAGHYNTLQAFSESLLEMTQTATYSGVQIRAQGDTLYVYDNSTSPPVTTLAFADIIGQPTWISAASLSFSTVMRADLVVGSQIEFPAGLYAPYVLTSQQAAFPSTPATSRLAFQGTFVITEVHHYGSYRDQSAESWRTVYVAVPNGQLGNISSYPTTPAQFA